MRAEEPDETEPAGFYVAGAEGWHDRDLKRKKARSRGRAREDERLYAAPDWWEEEEGS